MDNVASLLQKIIDESRAPGARALGITHDYTLRRLQDAPIAAKTPAELTPQDFLDYCRLRRATGVQAATINGEITYLVGTLKYAAEIWQTPGAAAALASFKAAKPQLVKQQLIGKSQSRDRRPTTDEIDRLLELAAQDDARPKNRIPMVPIIRFSLLTARRISETCRLRWDDLDNEKRICTVRDLKNPKGKGFHDAFPLLGDAWDIVQAQPRTNERIFPYNAKSVCSRYCAMKSKLGIEGLHLHDNRRECISAMFERGFNVPEVAKMSLHRNPAILLRTYTSLKAEDLHRGPASKRT